jgi:hypothetical protein
VRQQLADFSAPGCRVSAHWTLPIARVPRDFINTAIGKLDTDSRYALARRIFELLISCLTVIETFLSLFYHPLRFPTPKCLF